jgi:tetratricopeptide (TPR) repeat protein
MCPASPSRCWRYQLHAIVGEYAIDHFDEHNDGANRQALQEAHTRAAAYYVQMARNCPPREKRRNVKDVLPLIEGIWQFCQAGRWKEAYDLMNQEEIFDDVSRWGGNVLLLELCLMFLPVDKWHPERSDEALIYSRIAYIDGALGKKTEALGYFEQALTIRREVGNRFGEGITLHNIGVISFQRERYDVALACFWLAGILYVEVQSPSDVEDEEQMIGAVHQKVGEQQFAKLLAEVQAKATEIVEQALRDEFEC